jgi:hypothetical protein
LSSPTSSSRPSRTSSSACRSPERPDLKLSQEEALAYVLGAALGIEILPQERRSRFRVYARSTTLQSIFGMVRLPPPCRRPMRSHHSMLIHTLPASPFCVGRPHWRLEMQNPPISWPTTHPRPAPSSLRCGSRHAMHGSLLTPALRAPQATAWADLGAASCAWTANDRTDALEPDIRGCFELF